MKAIETIYHNYRFRSRLEARWAVFFDTLGVKYEYEKEGYALPNGAWYLPDFWLPDLDCWYEVKGSYADTGAMWDDWARLYDFCQQIQKHVYIAHGEIRVPAIDSVAGYNYPSTIDGFDPSFSLDDPRKAYPGRKFPEPFMMWVQSKQRGTIKLLSSMGNRDDHIITPEIVAAYATARQARFEHGETPVKISGQHQLQRAYTTPTPRSFLQMCNQCHKYVSVDKQSLDGVLCTSCQDKQEEEFPHKCIQCGAGMTSGAWGEPYLCDDCCNAECGSCGEQPTAKGRECSSCGATLCEQCYAQRQECDICGEYDICPECIHEFESEEGLKGFLCGSCNSKLDVNN